jgi:hypothetical protein
MSTFELVREAIMRSCMLFSLVVFIFFVTSPLIAETASVVKVPASSEISPKTGMVDGWLDKARAFRFVDVVVQVNGKKEACAKDLSDIIKPYVAKFMTKDEADSLFREVRGYYKKEKIVEGVSLSIQKEIFLIDIMR